jgi:hypothetical protein
MLPPGTRNFLVANRVMDFFSHVTIRVTLRKRHLRVTFGIRSRGFFYSRHHPGDIEELLPPGYVWIFGFFGLRHHPGNIEETFPSDFSAHYSGNIEERFPSGSFGWFFDPSSSFSPTSSSPRNYS